MTRNSRQRIKRHRMIRSKIHGTSERPRLSVYRGIRHLYVQLIDDNTQKTIIGLSDKKLSAHTGMDRARALAKELAQRAQEKKISAVTFDRGGFKYHGQVKAIADTLRGSGITI